MSKSDDFYLACRGAQVTPPERRFIRQMAVEVGSAFDAPVFVNIGVLYGATMHCLRAGCNKALLIGVDINYRPQDVQEHDRLRARFLKGDSGVLGKTFTDAVHLLFIDGGHYYGTVRADIDGWGPHVVVGGVMIFHDYNPTLQNLARWPELSSVQFAIDEWAGSNEGWKRYDAPDSLACFKRIV